MTRYLRLTLAAALALGVTVQAASAAQVYANIRLATPDGPGAPVGSVVIKDTAAGASFRMTLHGLPPGQHGFHVHHSDSCDPTMKGGMPVPAGKAGGHEDPSLSFKHEGPSGRGHLGDLPFLNVAADGTDTEILVAPRIKEAADLIGHSLVIHEGGDNYSDKPDPLGGGGARIACGAVQ